MVGERFRFWVVLGLLVGLGWTSQGWAQEATDKADLDVQDWLGRSRVQLVAVEFYATHCKPCMEAVPRWKKLHERYKEQGLRLLVVSVEDANQAKCARLPWRPEDSFCDLEGELANRFKVNALPAAFLWSWQGDLLVERGHIDEVETAVKSYFKEAPRVVVDARDDTGARPQPDEGLRAEIQRHLGNRGKMTVVLNEEERAALFALRRQSRAATRRDKQRCKMGVELSANIRLQARRTRIGRKTQLVLTLQDAETECQIAQASTRWSARNPERTVAAAVDQLLDNLRQPLALPGGGQATSSAADTWEPEGFVAKAVVRFESTPDKAMVLVDGEVLCQETPCSRSVSPGTHEVAMQKAEHLVKSSTEKLKNGQTIRWKLEENFARVTVKTDPPGVEVYVDDISRGETPIKDLRLSPGAHALSVKDPCFQPHEQSMEVKRGKKASARLKLEPVTARLKVLAITNERKPVAAKVWVDDVVVGRTNETLEIPACSSLLEIRHPEMGFFRKDKLKLRPGRATTVKFKMVEGQSKGPHGITWIHMPGDESTKAFFIAKTETTVAQYEACVRADACSSPQEVWGRVMGSGSYNNPLDFSDFHHNWAAPGRKRHPVNDVDKDQATAFCKWVEGRLPTDAEWTYAASGGRPEIPYPWGTQKPTCRRTVMAGRGYDYGCGNERTAKVCSKRKGNTPQGLCDMVGNVAEWIHDDRAVRGGSFRDGGDEGISIASRQSSGDRKSADFANQFNWGGVGFRCARDKNEAESSDEDLVPKEPLDLQLRLQRLAP